VPSAPPLELRQKVFEDLFPKPNPHAWQPLPHQVPPAGEPGIDWGLWVLLGGRGTGKTEGGHGIRKPSCVRPPMRHPCSWWSPHRHRGSHLGGCLRVGRGRPSGLKAHNPEIRSVTRQGGSYVIWPNGAEGKLFGSFTPQDVERLRSGGNRCLYLAEEIAAWRQLVKSWPHMRYGLRIGPHPHIVGATTPKPRKFLMAPIKDPRTTHGTTDDNPHLAPSVRAASGRLERAAR
jgi:phage terminase large subunit-like protein